jgi:hypothetical protein
MFRPFPGWPDTEDNVLRELFIHPFSYLLFLWAYNFGAVPMTKNNFISRFAHLEVLVLRYTSQLHFNAFEGLQFSNFLLNLMESQNIRKITLVLRIHALTDKTYGSPRT